MLHCLTHVHGVTHFVVRLIGLDVVVSVIVRQRKPGPNNGALIVSVKGTDCYISWSQTVVFQK